MLLHFVTLRMLKHVAYTTLIPMTWQQSKTDTRVQIRHILSVRLHTFLRFRDATRESG